MSEATANFEPLAKQEHSVHTRDTNSESERESEHTTHHFHYQHTSKMMKTTSLVALLVAASFMTGESYTTSHDLRQRNRKIWNMPITDPSTAPKQDLNMLKTSSTEQERRPGWKLSQAAVNTMEESPRMARSAASPTSPLAHGLLSPETVSRMDEITEGGSHNHAVRLFLQTYRRKGPMSCLEILSDPDVLPHLTNAMRDIA